MKGHQCIWPNIANPGEVYIQFPQGWTWPQAEKWLSEHNLAPTRKPSDMPYRWAAWRPLKGTKRPIDVYAFA
jgi:hypothetical protein